MLTVPVPDQVEVPLTVTVLLSKVLVADPEMAMPAPDEMTVDPEPSKEPPVQVSLFVMVNCPSPVSVPPLRVSFASDDVLLTVRVPAVTLRDSGLVRLFIVWVH